MSQAKRLNAQLFIEGRSVPFIGATCSFRSSQPSTATIELVPLREINDVLPRTMVHLFIKDFNAPGEDKPWVLAFEGEIYGYSLGKNPSNRSFTLMCMGTSNYWDHAKQAYLNLKTAMSTANNILNATKVEDEAAKNNMKFVSSVGDLKAYLVTIINNKMKSGDPNAFLKGVLDIFKGIEEINPFFKYNNLRYRISDRIGFAGSGDLKEIFDFTGREKYLESLMGRGNGGIMTVRQLINYLMGLVFHHFVSVPFPSKINAASGTPNGIGKSNNKTIGSFIFKPDSFMLPPPRCNVIYPDQYNNFGFTRNFFHEVTRVDFKPGQLAADILLNLQPPRIFQPTYYAPSSYSSYQGAEKDASEVSGGHFDNSGTSGKYGDSNKESKSAITLKEFHFMSYEEILKGIFGDQGNMLPSAQVLSQVASAGEQGRFFQRATDFMFFKKRYASRNTSMGGPLNITPVPGFPILIIDDSEAEQHVVGNLEGITHSITANGGGFTQYEVSYGRLVEEKDLWEGTSAEPPIPPWYDKALYGSRRKVEEQDYKNLAESVQDRVKKLGENLGEINDFGNSSIGEVYASLLGSSKEDGSSYLGSTPITSTKFPNIIAATLDIARRYQWAKSKGVVSEHIYKYTKRNYVLLHEAFEFLGAKITDSQKQASYYKTIDNIVFKGDRFDGGFVNTATSESSRDVEIKDLFSSKSLEKRRVPIDKYRAKLFTKRGFRG